MELISRATLNIMTGSIFALWISSTCVFFDPTSYEKL